MQHINDISDDRLAGLSEMLPRLRGALSTPTDVEGRPERVVIGVSPDQAPADASFADSEIDQIASALQSGESRISVADLGVIERAEPRQGDLAGQIAVVTGGAGGLGFAVAEELTAQGAAVALLDIAEDQVRAAAEHLGGVGFVCDVTSPEAVDQTVNRVVAAYGGVDILISNAGAAHQGSLLELDDESFQKAFALNFWSHHYVARATVRIMKRQNTGGALVFNVSKQSVNPGPNFAAYGTPKAALMALMRQYAVEHGADGITSNAVNADRIRTGLMTDDMVEKRSQARGLTPEQYMRGNLVRREVTGKDVAEAFVHLAKARTSTGAVITVDGGNVAAMMR